MLEKYRLQICSHAEVFDTRESAMTYINRYFMPDCLLGEPTLYFYGDEDEPSVIMAFGLGDRRYATVDIGKTNDQLSALETSVLNDSEELANAVTLVKGLIAAVGLTYDTNKIENQITYDPDTKDAIIGDADTLTEAVSLLSAYVQENFSDNSITVQDSEGIALTYESGDSGKVLSADVKISEHGSSDNTANNDNIIGLKSDGLYATVNLEYDAEKNQLMFVTSGMVDGKFMDDANMKTIDLGAHTEYTADNEDHTIEVSIADGKVSADAKISEDGTNILAVQDGKLLVSGTASNITYKDGTVFSTLEGMEEAIGDLQAHVDSESVTVSGTSTETATVTVTEEEGNRFSVATDVKLGTGHSIVVKNGGLEADVEVSVDADNNKLVVRVGDTTNELPLPDASIIDYIDFDAENSDLSLVMKNGTTITLPIKGLVTAGAFEVDETDTLHLDLTRGSNGLTLTGSVKLSTVQNNIIMSDENGLYATVLLSYDRSTNVLKLLANGTEVSSYQLSDHTLVNDGYYDSSTKSIVLVISTDDGTEQLSIPVADIINAWTVSNDDNSPITLTKTTNSDGVSVLSASLVISAEEHNAVLNNNGTLFVSNEASHMVCNWSGTGEVTIQLALEYLREETDKIPGIQVEIEAIKEDIEENTAAINENKGSIDTLTTQVGEISSRVTNLETLYTIMNETVSSHTNRLDVIDTKIVEIDNHIDQVVSDYTAADAALKEEMETSLAAEAAAREQADQNLQDALAQEVADRTAADEALKEELETSLAAEASARETADKALDERLIVTEDAIDNLIDFGEY